MKEKYLTLYKKAEEECSKCKLELNLSDEENEKEKKEN